MSAISLDDLLVYQGLNRLNRFVYVMQSIDSYFKRGLEATRYMQGVAQEVVIHASVETSSSNMYGT